MNSSHKAPTVMPPKIDERTTNWLLFLGILLIGLGILAIIFDFFTTLLTVTILGALIAAGGVILLINSLRHWQNWRPYWINLLMGLLYLIVGGMLLYNPIMGAVSLTFILGVFYIVIGVFRLIYSSMRYTFWGILSGIIALLLGIMILASWPASSLFIIGLFVGIDLLFAGWALIALRLA